MKPLHLSAIHYSQKIGDATIITFSKFHQVGIKTKKVMEGNGILPPPPPQKDWETSTKLGLDIVKALLAFTTRRRTIMYWSKLQHPPLWFLNFRLLGSPNFLSSKNAF